MTCLKSAIDALGLWKKQQQLHQVTPNNIIGKQTTHGTNNRNNGMLKAVDGLRLRKQDNTNGTCAADVEQIIIGSQPTQ